MLPTLCISLSPSVACVLETNMAQCSEVWLHTSANITSSQCTPGDLNLDQKFQRQKLFFLITLMQNKLESVNKNICYWDSL